MFGIGFSEIVTIFLIIIIFVRPDDLPKFLRNAGRLYGKAKKFYNELIQVKDRIIKEMDEATTLEEKPKDTPKISSEIITPETKTIMTSEAVSSQEIKEDLSLTPLQKSDS